MGLAGARERTERQRHEHKLGQGAEAGAASRRMMMVRMEKKPEAVNCVYVRNAGKLESRDG